MCKPYSYDDVPVWNLLICSRSVQILYNVCIYCSQLTNYNGGLRTFNVHFLKTIYDIRIHSKFHGAPQTIFPKNASPNGRQA